MNLVLLSAYYKNAPIVKFEPIFCKKVNLFCKMNPLGYCILLYNYSHKRTPFTVSFLRWVRIFTQWFNRWPRTANPSQTKVCLPLIKGQNTRILRQIRMQKRIQKIVPILRFYCFLGVSLHIKC